MTNRSPYWFPAKRYGLGWGFPSTWQGKIVLSLFFVFLLVGYLTIFPLFGNLFFFAYTLFLSFVLMAICWIKGERPQSIRNY
jgi:hypothetical protein